MYFKRKHDLKYFKKSPIVRIYNLAKMWAFTIMTISHKFVIYLMFSKLNCAIGSQHYLIYKLLIYACFGFHLSPSYYILRNAQTKILTFIQSYHYICLPKILHSIIVQSVLNTIKNAHLLFFSISF